MQVALAPLLFILYKKRKSKPHPTSEREGEEKSFHKRQHVLPGTRCQFHMQPGGPLRQPHLIWVCLQRTSFCFTPFSACQGCSGGREMSAHLPQRAQTAPRCCVHLGAAEASFVVQFCSRASGHWLLLRLGTFAATLPGDRALGESHLIDRGKAGRPPDTGPGASAFLQHCAECGFQVFSKWVGPWLLHRQCCFPLSSGP